MSSNELNRTTNPENGRINNNNNNNIRFNETNPVDKSSRRTSSFFGSLLSSISIPNQTPNPSSEPRHYDSPPSGKSLACSTNSEQGSVSTFNPDNMSFSGSPHSATSSSISGYNPQKFDQSPPIAYQQLHHRSFSTSPHSNTLPNGQNPHRRASLSNNWTGLIWSSSSQQPSDSTFPIRLLQTPMPLP
ncbi:hypothetical protein BY996DRAFT_6486225 [Phakopsora pachyrhizi]|nr:hypothetical protein BY996DRAFT_6486225 [Phakopsora pachyrhizi]